MTRAVKVGRIQNFKNWSPDMVPDHAKTSLGLEYFCTEGDDLWNMPDDELIELGKREVERIGLASSDDIRTDASSACPRPIRSTTPAIASIWPRCAQFVDGLEELPDDRPQRSAPLQ